VFGSAGTTGLGDSFHFKDEISGVAGSDSTNRADGGHTSASIADITAGTHEAPAISAEAQAIEPFLSGQHSADNFIIGPHPAANAVITHVPHDLIV
jgi:hypothetical protein